MHLFKVLFGSLRAAASQYSHAAKMQNSQLQNSRVRTSFSCGTGCLSESGGYHFAPPMFLSGGQMISAVVDQFSQTGTPLWFAGGVTEYSLAGSLTQDPYLVIVAHVVEESVAIMRAW